MEQTIIQADLSTLRFIQGYVKKPTVEAKRWIEHLRSKWGNDWRDHRFDLVKDVKRKVIDQLAFVELNLPLEVEQRDEIYIVQNGTHTAYSYWKRGIQTIPVTLSNLVCVGTRQLYTLEQIRVEEE